ncbi:MAG: hypothetical protein ABL934_11770 [Lysobacteraceae bacterium]
MSAKLQAMMPVTIGAQRKPPLFSQNSRLSSSLNLLPKPNALLAA